MNTKVAIIILSSALMLSACFVEDQALDSEGTALAQSTGVTLLFCDESARIEGTGFGSGRARAAWGAPNKNHREARINARREATCDVAALDATAIADAEKKAIDNCVTQSLDPYSVDCQGNEQRSCSLSIPVIDCKTTTKPPNNQIRCEKNKDGTTQCQCEAWTSATAKGLNRVLCS